MKIVVKYKRTAAVTCIIFITVLTLTRCMNSEQSDKTGDTANSTSTFAGSASCAPCHSEISKSHLATAHYLTSGIAGEKNIKGSFDTGKNVFAFSINAFVAMEKRPGGFFQVHYQEGREKMARPFDIVIGSGTKGQTFLHWYNNRLLQLPITYFTATSQWCNSPGYPGKVVFNRQVTSRCLECHTTYADIISEPGKEPESFDRNTIMYGVDCEKCHGPAAEHVAYQTSNPAVKTAKYIVNPAKLSRQQNLDLCILCHGGKLQKKTASFTFKAGDALNDHFTKDNAPQFAAEIDVHGNQYGLMASSKCFTQSKTMTCNSCHNSHTNEAGQLKVFSQRCISCHQTEHVNDCKMNSSVGEMISNNCVDCHMPMEQSKAIVVLLPGKDAPTPAQMRSHYIKVYPNETKKFMEQLRPSPGQK